MPNTAETALKIATQIVQAPATKVIIDKIQNWHGPKFLLGPLGIDLTKDFQNFRAQHNRGRNLLHGIIIIVTAIVSIVLSQISPEFRTLLGAFATAFHVTKNSKDLTDPYYIYVAYMFSTNLASILTNILFDMAFLCVYGDREFHLTTAQIEALATEFGSSPDAIKNTFDNMVQQLRQGHFALGASEEDLHKVLQAMQSKHPKHAKATFDAHAAAFNACLETMAKTTDVTHLTQYRRMLNAAPRLIEQEDLEHRRADSHEQPFLAQRNTTQYGTSALG